MSNQIMNVQDSISGSLAECYMTISGTRYNFMQIIKFESKVEKNKVEVPILGKTGKSNKASGWKGTFSGTAHYNQSIMRKMLLAYKESGEDTYFTTQITNEDSNSSIGRQTVILKQCNLDGGILAKIDVSADYLDEDISGTFDDFEIPETFSLIDGME